MYEYRVTQLLAGGNISHLNDRMAVMVNDGWEPIMMCGDNTISVMMRRQKPAEQAHHTEQARHPAMLNQTAEAPAPQAPAAPGIQN